MRETFDEPLGLRMETGSEAVALAKILAWSQEWPDWLSDALRRLCTMGTLEPADIDELTALCKCQGEGAVPLTAEDIPDPIAATVVVELRSIHGVQNINALKPGERLTFDRSGLTIVYGDNGSGKSGYVRVLKKVCRARSAPHADTVLPNIYATDQEPQQAVVEFRKNGQVASVTWTPGTGSDPILSAVSVFDSSSANIHVDKSNDVAYTPFPMRVLKQVADSSKEVRKRVRAEIDNLDRQTPEVIKRPACHHHTQVGKLIAGLSGELEESSIRDLGSLSDEEAARLRDLRHDLATNPTSEARRIEALKERLDCFDSNFRALEDAVCDEQAVRLDELHRQWQTNRAATRIASAELFADEPLPGVGSDVWRQLWKAAKSYSEQKAYTGARFPVTGATAHCVLCQQELDVSATNRLSRFERFVKDETKQREELSTKAYQTALDDLTDAGIDDSDVSAAIALVRDELQDGETAACVKRTAEALLSRQQAIVRNQGKGNKADPLPPLESWPSTRIDEHSAALESRVTALSADEESLVHKQLQREFEDLTDREWLARVQEDVIAEIRRRRQRAALEAVLPDTTTNRITTKSSELAELLVTNALGTQFSREIDRLGVAGLAVELFRDKSSYGAACFRVRLTRKPGASVGEILSEGEHRCVALAAFLAELATAESRSAIVFDDPVSSLDHGHRKAVAKRLAEEGQRRQVIVLTHDIVFLFLLEQACREISTHVGFRSVTHTDDFAGFIQQDPPARAQPIDHVIDGMQKQFNNERYHYENGDHDKWEQTVDKLGKRLRWTWERAVEEAVGPVVKRLSNKVDTKGLAKVTVLTIDDCQEMRQAYRRCSNLLHSSADALNPLLPHPNRIQAEISKLQDWTEDVRRRQKELDWSE